MGATRCASASRRPPSCATTRRTASFTPTRLRSSSRTCCSRPAMSEWVTGTAPERSVEPHMRIEPAFLFDLDGTLVDSVYQHVLAWQEALDEDGIELSV